MQRLSGLRAGRRAWTVLAAASAVLAVLAAGSGAAWAAGVNVKLPYSIAYDLAPIQVDLEGGPHYAIYDLWKRPVAQGDVSGNQTVTFTPPKFGWYVVECGTYEKDHMTSGVAKFIGVTPKYPNLHTLAQGELRGGWNDEALHAFAGLLLDRTNTRMGWENADRVIADAQKYGVTLLMQFESAPSLDQVKEAVTRLKGRVKYWEIVNEPNYSMSPQAYANLVKQVYPLIKSLDPAAVVMGPSVCGIQLGWYEAFYKAGGGPFVDAVSIHDYEGHEGIDIFHWNYKLGKLREIMAAGGDAKKPIWQTERAIAGIRHGFIGASQAIRISLQRDILETFSVTNEHNAHYYANVTGYNDVPTFVYSESGPHPAALVCRTRAAMIRGRKFVGKVNFGPTGNQIFLGLRYQGDDGSTITLRNLGCLDLALEVSVTGGESLEVVDGFGNTTAVPVNGGKATVTVSQVPCYLRLAKGQNVTVPPWNFGENIAAQAKFTYSGGTKSDPKILTDGKFQDYYPDRPFGEHWKGAYAGKVFNEKPETFEIAFAKPRTIEKMIIYGVRADNPFSAILDYDLQYFDGQDWKTLEEVRTPCPASDVVQTYMCKNLMWYLDNNFFVHQFKKPVETDKLRMVVRRITRGCITDMIAEAVQNAGKPADQWWHASGERLELREIEIYGAPASAAPAK